jgi:hypothetical protein
MPKKSYRRLILTVLCVLLCGAFCCAPPKPARVVPHFHAKPLVQLRMHADIDFTSLERALIDQAVKDLLWQTAGYLVIDLEYDLNFTDADVLRREALLVRIPSWSPLTMRVDEAHRTQVYGFKHTDKPHCFIVADRLDTPELWRHVVMHELLHAAGLKDLPTTPADIMAKARTPKVPLCMSRADANEFCRVNKCQAERLNTCGT